jgi:hypothetical protein
MLKEHIKVLEEQRRDQAGNKKKINGGRKTRDLKT